MIEGVSHATFCRQIVSCVHCDCVIDFFFSYYCDLTVIEGVSTNSDKRVDALLMLRSKGLITKAEFEQMRRRIIHDLGLQL